MTFKPGQLLTRGYLPKREVSRLENTLGSGDSGGIRLLALHHSVVPNSDADSVGLSRSKTALARLVGTGIDVLLCSNPGRPTIDVYGGVVVAGGGSLSAADCKGSNAIFRRITVSEDSIRAEEFLWQPVERVFSKGDVHVFSRRKAPARG